MFERKNIIEKYVEIYRIQKRIEKNLRKTV